MSQPPESLNQRYTLAQGQTFEGRFEILSVLGQGGVGVVYKARQTHMNKIVAIKTLMLSVVGSDVASFKRFEQEAQAASSLNHANIISIFDFGKSADGLAYLVMEYLGSKTLDDVLESEKRLGPDKFLRVATQICEGLQHAHRKGVIHRDIKPTNIMLMDTEDGADIVKIVDFGLAKLTAIEAEKHLTQTGTIVGTPLYMSPEQCRGMELDHRSDIYSLGCVLYTALTGKEPIQGNTALDTLYKHTATPPLPFKEACPEINLPPRLEQAILKSLQKDPDQRQQSMMELRNDLTDAIFYRSYNSGINVGNIAPETVRAASSDTAPDPSSAAQGLSQTLKMSDSVKQTPTAPVPPPSQMPAQAPPPAVLEDDKKKPTLRHIDTQTKDHVVISKTTLASIGVSAALVVAAGAFILNARNTATGPAATLPSQAIATTTTSSTPAASFSASPPEPVPLPLANSEQKKEPSDPIAKNSVKIKEALAPAPAVKKTPPKAPESPEQAERRRQQSAKIETLQNALAASNKALDEMSHKDFGVAEGNFNLCLQLQKKALGNADPRLFPTMAHIIASELQQQNADDRVKANLVTALQIFDRDPPKVHAIVEKLKAPILVWRPMARASFRTARQTHNLIYYDWAKSFYKLALASWTGPKENPELLKLEDEYKSVLDQEDSLTRQTAKQQKKASKQLSAAQNARAAKQSDNKAKKPHSHYSHNGRMWQR